MPAVACRAAGNPFQPGRPSCSSRTRARRWTRGLTAVRTCCGPEKRPAVFSPKDGPKRKWPALLDLGLSPFETHRSNLMRTQASQHCRDRSYASARELSLNASCDDGPPAPAAFRLTLELEVRNPSERRYCRAEYGRKALRRIARRLCSCLHGTISSFAAADAFGGATGRPPVTARWRPSLAPTRIPSRLRAFRLLDK